MSLYEVNEKFIEQDSPPLRKRWFQGEGVDLWVWQEEGGRIVRFQMILYGRDILEWTDQGGVQTGRLDPDEVGVGGKMSPTFRFEAVPRVEVLEQGRQEFLEQSEEVDWGIRTFVLDQLSPSDTAVAHL